MGGLEHRVRAEPQVHIDPGPRLPGQYLWRRITDPRALSWSTAKAVEGFLRSLHDPFARLVPLEDDDAQLASEGLSHTGIGLRLLQVGRAHLVEGVVPTGPAAAHDIAPGDVIVSVDGWSTAGLSARSVEALLQGPRGSSVRVVRRRSGADTSLLVTRSDFLVPHVVHDVYTRAEGRVGWLRISSFHSERVCAQTRSALKTLTSTPLDAMVLDLRTNPGGLVDQAVCVAGLLAGPGVAVTRLESSRSETRYRRAYATAKSAKRRYQGPVVVLVDARSQSAAELLTGALRRSSDALVVGQRTFGKGSVQDAMEWAPGVPVAMYREVARYLLAGDQRLHLAGITPDIPLTANGNRRVTPAVRADLAYWNLLAPPTSPSPAGTARSPRTTCPTVPSGRWHAKTSTGRLAADPQLFASLDIALFCRPTAASEGTP